jgi:sulfide:quinone oxidoreductase
MTPFPDVYAIGDVVDIPMAKAGVFAENAAAVVAEDIRRRLRGEALERRYEGEGNCYVEFGSGRVAQVQANFLGGQTPTARVVGPSEALADEKRAFASTRQARWFGGGTGIDHERSEN